MCSPHHKEEQMKTSCSLVMLAVASGLVAQNPVQVQVGNAAPYLLVSGDVVRCATRPAAPTERLKPPTPNPKNLVDTGDLAYIAWVTNSTSTGAAVHFTRSTDGGKTWSVDKVIHSTLAGVTIQEMSLVAEGNEVFVIWQTDESDSALGLPAGSINSSWHFIISGSDDQGQTWTKPVVANPAQAKAGSTNVWGELLQAAVTRDVVSKNVRVHLSYEWGTRSPAGEGPSYTAWELVAGTMTQVNAEKDVSQGKFREIDYIGIQARDNVVMISYRDDRPVNSLVANRLYGTWSIDGGRTWRKSDLLLGRPNDLTMNNPANNSMAESCYGNMAIDGANLYFMWRDRSHGQATPPAVNANERVILQYSNNLGFTWNWTVVTDYAMGLADVDEHWIEAANGRVVIGVCSDERGRHKGLTGMKGTLTNTPADAVTAMDNQGNGNHNDQVQVLISEDAGKTIASRAWLSQPPVDSGDPATASQTGTLGAATLKGTKFVVCWNLSMAVRGDVIRVCWEEEHYEGFSVFQGQDVMLATSSDFGKTWGSDPVPHKNTINLTRKSSPALGFTTDPTGVLVGSTPHADVDDPLVAITPNCTAIVGVRQANPHGASDRPQAISLALPLCVDTPTVSLASGGPQNLRIDVGPAHSGSTYFVAGSFNLGAGPHGIRIHEAWIPLAPDPYMDLTIGLKNTPVFSNTVGTLDTRGRGAAAINVPKNSPSSAIGFSLWHAGVVINPSGIFKLGTNVTRLQFTK
jgi:hypothetical protein